MYRSRFFYRLSKDKRSKKIYISIIITIIKTLKRYELFLKIEKKKKCLGRFLHVFRVNGLLFVFGSFLIYPPNPTPPSSSPSRLFSSPVLCSCGLGESCRKDFELEVGYVLPPSSSSWVFSSCCWSLALLWEGSLDIKLIIKPVRLCPASQPCLPPTTTSSSSSSSSTVWGIPAFPWCSCTSCDLTRSALQAILLYSPPILPP